MKHLIVRLLNFFGILCGIKLEAVVVCGPNGKNYRVTDAKLDEYGTVLVTVLPSRGKGVALCLEESSKIEFDKSFAQYEDRDILSAPIDSAVRSDRTTS